MKTKKLILLIATILVVVSCGTKEKINLPNDCYFNDLPNWIKQIIVIEGISINIIIVLSLILIIKIKKLEKK